MRELKRKITRLEEQVNMKTISPEDRVQVIEGHKWEREKQIEKRKIDLMRKYGPQALEEIRFIEIVDRFPDEEAQG